jgi:hypothetical protein
MRRPLWQGDQKRIMADLEEHAFKRDKRFVVRLVLTLSLSALFGLYIYEHLTSRRTAGCAADSALGSEASDAAPPAP